VIALSTGGDEKDVRGIRDQLKLTYPIVPAPITKVIKDFDLTTDRNGTTYGTVIIDKNSVIRFIHNSTDASVRTPVAEIRRVLQEIRQ
jgi:alkyl hydroperoxide reductase subunit AhpC